MTLRFSTNELTALWLNDSRYKKFTKLHHKTYAQGFKRRYYRKLIAWNPNQENPSRDLSSLKIRFHPAIAKDSSLFKINTTSVNIFFTAFNWEPVIEGELTGFTFLKKCITVHPQGFTGQFRATISEVLNQLPQDVVETEGDFYFTTEKLNILSDPIHMHEVAVTTIYRV